MKPIVTYLGNTIQDYAPTAWLSPCREYDLTDQPCDYSDAIREAELAVKQ